MVLNGFETMGRCGSKSSAKFPKWRRSPQAPGSAKSLDCGRTRWRKRKGIARVRLTDGTVHLAELHWYEGSGIGRKEFKIKNLL